MAGNNFRFHRYRLKFSVSSAIHLLRGKKKLKNKTERTKIEGESKMDG